jgi:hypothetical protein
LTQNELVQVTEGENEVRHTRIEGEPFPLIDPLIPHPLKQRQERICALLLEDMLHNLSHSTLLLTPNHEAVPAARVTPET